MLVVQDGETLALRLMRHGDAVLGGGAQLRKLRVSRKPVVDL